MVPSRPHHLNRQRREEFHRAIECFEEASARSPGYAPAFSGMAVAWHYLGLFAMDAPFDTLPKAQKAAARALEIDDCEGDALSVSRAARLCSSGSGPKLKHCSGGLSTLSPEATSALICHLIRSLPIARIEEALSMLDEAKRIDPLSLLVAASRGAVLLMARRVGEAELSTAARWN